MAAIMTRRQYLHRPVLQRGVGRKRPRLSTAAFEAAAGRRGCGWKEGTVKKSVAKAQQLSLVKGGLPVEDERQLAELLDMFK
jgi:hypothetical protein